MFAAGALFVWILLGIVGAVLTTWWVRRTWQGRKQLHVAAKLLAVIVAGAAVFGAVGTMTGLVKGFGAVGGESVDPSQKARMLAEGISEAMNCTAFALIIWVPSIVVGVLMTRSRVRKDGD